MVPGLLQTEDYARALNRAFRPATSDDEVERRIAARMARQWATLDRDEPPELTCILNEAVLSRCLAADRDLASGQFGALVAASERPHVTIRVLPYAAGLHSGMDGAFVVMSFPDAADPDVAHVGGLMGSVFIESVEAVNRYKLVWEQMSDVALAADESRDLLNAELKRL